MRRQLGFNLLEVLIALVILSVGLLGLAALQITSLQQNQSAYMRSQATLLAYDIADRMRANNVGTNNNNYFVALGNLSPNCVNSLGAANGCTPAEMASHDIAEWQAALAVELNQGSGRVCRSDLNGDAIGVPNCEGNDSNNPIVIYVWWNDDKAASGASTQLTVSVSL